MKRQSIGILSPLAGALLTGCGSEGDSSASGAPAAGNSASAPASRNAGPVGIAPCEGVRPGAAVVVEGSQCTLNFVYRDGAGTEYVGTVGALRAWR